MKVLKFQCYCAFFTSDRIMLFAALYKMQELTDPLRHRMYQFPCKMLTKGNCFFETTQ